MKYPIYVKFCESAGIKFFSGAGTPSLVVCGNLSSKRFVGETCHRFCAQSVGLPFRNVKGKDAQCSARVVSFQQNWKLQNLEKEKPLISTESIVKLKWPYVAHRAEVCSGNRKSQGCHKVSQSILRTDSKMSQSC